MTGARYAKRFGRLVCDPEQRRANSGTAVTNITVAVDQGFGERKKTAFCDVTAFGKTAEFVGDYLRKGSLVAVEGQVTQDNWEDRSTGQKRSKICFIANRVSNLSPREQGSNRQQGNSPSFNQQQQPAPPQSDTPPPPFPAQQQPTQQEFDVSDESIDDIPF
ncbi:MAG: single-stranded DNA-binding protein [Deltaproteobacteria bacterium]|nr:single-stranded DNA-binding protein [Deltaproteobacteria bacterium]